MTTTTIRPEALVVDEGGIPATLKALPQWVVWRYVEEVDPATGEVDWDKPPVNARTGSLASSTDPATWSDYATAYAVYRDSENNLDGIGFVLWRLPGDTAPGIVAADLDHCRDPRTGEVEVWTQSVLDALPSYAEVSPSGTGLRVLCLGKLPPRGRKKGRFEVYETARYITITGHRLAAAPPVLVDLRGPLLEVHARFFPEPQARPEAPPPPHRPFAADDDAILQAAFESRVGATFRRLWEGDWSGYGSQSEADLALCNYLAFFCGPDRERIADLFARSGLFRSKWQRADYRARTVEKSLEGRTEFYGHNGQERYTGTSANGTGHVPPPPPPPWEPPVPLNALPEVPAFPLDVLPGPLRDYAEKLAHATNAPPDFAAVPMLAAAAGALGNARWLEVTGTHRQPPILFAAVIGRPGSGKSTPLDFVLSPLHAAEALFYREWQQEKAQAREGEKKPALRRCLLDDTTVEAMCRVLSDNPRGCIMARDELAALVTGMNQYREGGKGSDRQIFLKIWSASTIKVDRSKLDGIPLTVRRPLLCVVGGIQPQVIDWLKGEQVGDKPPPDDGFFDRFLVSYPPDLPAVGEEWRDVPPVLLKSWNDAIDWLLGIPYAPALDSQDPLPRLLPLSPDGREAWVALTREHAAELNAEDFPDWLRGPWAKLVPGYAGRLALVLRMLRAALGRFDVESVDGQSVRQAGELIRYFKEHAKKVYTAMASDPRIREAALILAWLARCPGRTQFSRRDAYADLRRSFSSPDALGRPLDLLQGHHFLRELETEGRRGAGRKASQRYEVNPLWVSRNTYYARN